MNRLEILKLKWKQSIAILIKYILELKIDVVGIFFLIYFFLQPITIFTMIMGSIGFIMIFNLIMNDLHSLVGRVRK